MTDSIRFVPPEELGLRPRIGLAHLTKRAFDGESMDAVWADLVPKLKADPSDVDTAMDLALVAQLGGNQELGLQIQREALSVRTLYRAPCASAHPRLRVLAFAAATDIGGNTPLEFLLEDSDVELYTLYIVPGLPLPETLPEHEVAVVAVPDSDETRGALLEIQRLTLDWPRPVVNMPRKIFELERDKLCALLGGARGIAIPATTRVDRDDLLDVVRAEVALDSLLEDAQFPLIIRPVGSQAGRGLEKLESLADIEPYLEAWQDEDFFISRFVDYSGDDGLFRKYRIVFVDGKAYGCHMAIADQWRLWYLNADMAMSAQKRAEEEQFFATFDDGFAARHAGALAEIVRRTGLDYFAIDCAEAKNGGLLIFEADIAMIVHNMDPDEIYPYKGPQMRKVFAAYDAMLKARAHTDTAAAEAA